MSDTTYEAATVEEALEKAAAALGVDAGELQHEVVERKTDFWGGDDETVVIKAWKSAPQPEPEAAAEPEQEKAEEEAAAEPEQEKAEEEAEEPAQEKVEEEAAERDAEQAEAAADSEDADDREKSAPSDQRAAAQDEPSGEQAGESEDQPDEQVAAKDEQGAADEPEVVTEFDGEVRGDDEGTVEPEHVAALLEQIFHDMEFECTVEVATEADDFLVTVAGADKEELLEGNGRCLSALELLANNAFRNRLPRGSKIRVDAGDFRSKRDQELTDVAYQVAHSAKQSGRTQETQPLNPYERRLVHLALAEDPAVTTRSRGSGFLKNVQVIPQKGNRGGRGRQR